MKDKKIPQRQALVFGTTVTFQSRSTRIATVRWHTRLKEDYATVRDAMVAKQLYEQKGKILLAPEVAKMKQVDPATLPLFDRRNKIPASAMMPNTQPNYVI